MGPQVASAKPARTTASAFDHSIVQQVLVSLVAIKVAGLVLIFDPAGLQSFDLPKSLFSRAIAWLIAGALVFAVLRYGTGIVPRTRMHWAVGAFVVVNVLSTLVAENRYIALFGEEGHYLGLTFAVDMAVLYLAVAIAFRRFADWALFGGILGLATVQVLGYAALQYFGLDPISWNQPRPLSTLGNPDTLGRYLSLIFGPSVGVAVLGRGQVSGAVRMVAALLALAVLAAAALAGVRGTLLGITAVLFAVPFLYLRMRGAGRRDFALAGLAAVAAVGVLAAIFELTPVGARAQELVRNPSSEQGRVLLLDSALHAFRDRPLLGYGPDNFAAAYPRYRQAGALVGQLGHDAHNWLLQTAATTGGLGVLALLTAVVMSIWRIWTLVARRASAIGPALLLASVGYWVHASVTVASPGLDWFPYVAFGAVAIAGRRPTVSTPIIPNTASVLTIAAVVFIAAGAAAASLTGTAAFLANRDVAIAAGELQDRPQGAVAAAESAIRRDPGRAVYWYWLGRARDAQGAWSAAAVAYAEAAARTPYERAYWAYQARSLTHEAEATGAAGIAAAAIAAARRGTEVDPNEPSTHVALADAAYTLAQYDLSLGAAVRAISLWPSGNYDALAARAAARATDLRQARALLEDALRVRDTAALHLALAQLALKLGDAGTARAEARRTLELAPGNAAAQEVLRATGP